MLLSDQGRNDLYLLYPLAFLPFFPEPRAFLSRQSRFFCEVVQSKKIGRRIAPNMASIFHRDPFQHNFLAAN